MTVRKQVADQIKADNPEFTVKATGLAGAPDNLGSGKVYVLVWRTNVEPQSTGALLHTVRVEVMVGGTDEDFNDVALDQVLLSLQRINGLNFTSAEYSVFDDKFIGHAITTECYSENVYREIVIKEQ